MRNTTKDKKKPRLRDAFVSFTKPTHKSSEKILRTALVAFSLLIFFPSGPFRHFIPRFLRPPTQFASEIEFSHLLDCV